MHMSNSPGELPHDLESVQTAAVFFKINSNSNNEIK